MTTFYINDHPVDVRYSLTRGRQGNFQFLPTEHDELEITEVLWEVTMPIKIPLSSPSWPGLVTPPVPIRVDILPLLTEDQISQLETDIFTCENNIYEY
jgi:hypothetical protein